MPVTEVSFSLGSRSGSAAWALFVDPDVTAVILVRPTESMQSGSRLDSSLRERLT
jgi:hypothetical protein